MLAGFRNADANSYAEIDINLWGPAFYGYLNKVSYACAFPGDGSLDKIVAYLFSSPGMLFAISWGSDGVCKTPTIYRGSAYGQ